MDIRGTNYGLGHLIALLVLIACVMGAIFGLTLSPLLVLGLIGALALALLIP